MKPIEKFLRTPKGTKGLITIMIPETFDEARTIWGQEEMLRLAIDQHLTNCLTDARSKYYELESKHNAQ
jgi:hypothetical protein